MRGGAVTLDSILEDHRVDTYTVVKDPMFEQRKKEYLSKRSEDIDALRSEIKRLEDPNEMKTDFSSKKTVGAEKATLQKAKEDYDKLQALEQGLPIPGTTWYDSYSDMVSRIAMYRDKEADIEEASKKKQLELDASNQNIKDKLYWDNFFRTEKIRLSTAADTQQAQLDILIKEFRKSIQADLEKARQAYQAAKDSIDAKQKGVDADFEEFVKARKEDTQTYKIRLIEILAETKAFLEENLVAETKKELADLNEKSKIELADLKKRGETEIYEAQTEATTGQFDWQRKRAELRLPDLHVDAEKDRANLLTKYKQYEEKILADAEINWNSIQDIYFEDLKMKNSWAAVKPPSYFDIMAESSEKQKDILKTKADIASFEPTQQVVEDSLRQEGAAKLALDSALAAGNKDAAAVAQKTYEVAKASADKARTDAATAAQMKKDVEAKQEALLALSAEALQKRKVETPLQEIKVPVDSVPLKEVISSSGEILASLPSQYTNTPEYKAALEAIANARRVLEEMK